LSARWVPCLPKSVGSEIRVCLQLAALAGTTAARHRGSALQRRQQHC
jgi:hypothetical protein